MLSSVGFQVKTLENRNYSLTKTEGTCWLATVLYFCLFHKYQFCSLSHCGCLGMVQILLSSAGIVESMINEHEHEQANTTVLHLNYTWVTMMSSESHVVAVSTRLPRGTRDYIHFVSSLSSIYTQSPTTSSPYSTSHIPLRVIDDHISTSIQY